MAAPKPIPIESHALDNLRYIRETMERAGSFTAVPGWGGVMMGATALGAAGLASHASTPERWLATWMAEVVVALAVGTIALWYKARAANVSWASAPARKFALSLIPPLLTGAILTGVLYSTHQLVLVPGVWLMLYGVGVIAGGAFSVPVVPVMGGCFLVAGALLAILQPALALADFWLGACFGGLHVVFGAIIAKRYGG
jgi:hypothetical protein